MMATIEPNKTCYKLNARVKNSKKIAYNEKEVIKMSFGNDSSIPQTIYNRIQTNLNSGIKAQAILKVKMNDGSSYWVNNQFTPSHHTNDKQFSVSSDLVNENKLKDLKKLYNILHKIEEKISISQANKYLEGFLESHHITFNQLSKVK